MKALRYINRINHTRKIGKTLSHWGKCYEQKGVRSQKGKIEAAVL